MLLLCVLGFLSFVPADFLANKPSEIESLLIVTDGELYAVTADSQYSISFIVREKDGGLTKSTAIPIYTDFNNELRSHVGDSISVSHYEKLVVEYQIGGTQFCSPKCFSDYSCRMKAYESDKSSLRKSPAYCFWWALDSCWVSHTKPENIKNDNSMPISTSGPA